MVQPWKYQIQNVPAITTFPCGFIIPLFGLTQYFLGEVVFTLNPMFPSVELFSVIVVVTTSENGPVCIAV